MLNSDVTSKVYDALADIAFKTNATEEELLDAIEWFKQRFFVEPPIEG